MKPLPFKSIDLFKYTELIVDKQPTEAEINAIVQSYVATLQPTHIAISIPLDSNADFLAHGYVPAPLMIEDFTRVWIEAIHRAGVNVYYRGTFSGIKNMYDFGFDKTTPLGSADTAMSDGQTTWIGKASHWLNTHLGSIQTGDIIGIMPDATLNAFDGNFFLPPLDGITPQMQYLSLNIELKKLSDMMTAPIKGVHTGYTANLYKDIMSGWIPYIYGSDVNKVVAIDYDQEMSPLDLEKGVNDLFNEFREPIFISKFSVPLISLSTNDINLKASEYFETFARLRDKGLLVGVNYFDGIEYNEGIFSIDVNYNTIIGPEGNLVIDFFKKSGATPPHPQSDSIQVETKPITIEPKKPKVRPQVAGLYVARKEPPKKKRILVKKNPILIAKPVKPRKKASSYSLHDHDVSFLTKVTLYSVIGADATQITNLLTHSALANYTPYAMIVFTLIVAVCHAVLDGK